MSPDEALTKRRTPLQWIAVFLAGVCMGAADIVPGISGGTVAFIIGVYPELIESLKSFNGHAFKLLATLQFREFSKTVGWKFLLALVSGIAVSFLTLAQAFNEILGHETYRVYLYSAFFGLIIASVWFCAKQLKSWSFVHLLFLMAGGIAAYELTGTTLERESLEPTYDVHIVLEATAQRAENYADNRLLDVPKSTLSAMVSKGVIAPDVKVTPTGSSASGEAKDFINLDFSYGLDLWVVCCGAIAISAMLLPGISGSYLLTILGMYSVVIAALADFVAGLKGGIFEADAFFVLANMMAGIIIGAILFSRLVSWMLHHYHDWTIAALTGFMIGAIGSVWPFWSYTYYYLPLKLEKGPQLSPVSAVFPDFYSPLFVKACAFAVGGFLTVFVLEQLAAKWQKLEDKTTKRT